MEAKLHQSTVNKRKCLTCESPATEINVVAIRSVDREDTIVSKSIKVPMSHAPVDRSTNTQLAIIYLSKKVSKLKFIEFFSLSKFIFEMPASIKVIKEKILLYYKLVTLSTYIVIHGLVVSLCKVIPEVRAP
ncbi:hypothetical protein T4D_13240 [Trichinella pseudospiralis]|uniref:Uncharacterized protein n=1 Tax=Trichinella pseudospiralis TaxID=6337 RepID=A0A0V1FFV0_TRIPS|nr:hypothetical protein T4D_13240 [Trichinella pseudospiralis]